jgi:MoaD family protein
MLRVKVQLFFGLRNAIGERELDLDIENAGPVSLLKELASRYGDRLEPPLIHAETGEANPHYRMLVNGRDLGSLRDRPDGELRDGDVVQLFPPAAGG